MFHLKKHAIKKWGKKHNRMKKNNNQKIFYGPLNMHGTCMVYCVFYNIECIICNQDNYYKNVCLKE